MPPSAAALEGLVVPYLQRQPWFLVDMARYDKGLGAGFALADLEIVRDGRPGLASVVVAVGDRPFHVLVGWRDPSEASASLRDHQGTVLGMSDDGEGEVLCYDALADEALATELLSVASGGAERAVRARVVESLVSHASLVCDERLFLKSYRVLEPEPRAEVEFLSKLEQVGFAPMLRIVGHWKRSGWDLAVVREYVPGAVEGRRLALTSLRDLFGRPVDEERLQSEGVGGAGGDLASEMRRLGEVTAQLHLALAEAFGVRSLGEKDAPASAIRVHGDYHLRRVFRTDAGWVVAGFGDDPLIGRPERHARIRGPRFASPLEDLADMSYALRQVAAEAVATEPASRWATAERLARFWHRRNSGAFLDGYLSEKDISKVLPISRGAIAENVRSLVAMRIAAAT